ncbi:TatD family hydrolase [Paenibacillus hexagrammi]|uniref:YchF/TatD family DNA exonuclease n=1 Tax=Paenibacillus hexagrammi TaxID=2908839 RepID=A0ABY3SGQ9_9BACL|nr:TatD family hydrolase [Paenibacillus sp. YPD9-1]UJF32668.1 YchF/TatD family DNA exonuclease [Paenibacillus sp. YPD9-1]
MNHPIVDIGVNLMHRSFHQDREQVVKRAAANHVSPLILTGTSLKNSIETARYAGRYSGELYATAGVHPHDAKSCNQETIVKLKELAVLPQVVAIGECGLDYNRDFSPRDVQRKWFAEQIRLALELDMPLFLHEREACKDFIALLKEHSVQKAVVHCFTGTQSELKAYLEMGFYIGITGWICDERRGKHLRDLVRIIPTDRLMIETDAPFLTPRDLKEKPTDGRNEPAFLPHILQAVARYMGRPVEEVARATTATAKEFFGI